MPVPQHRGFLRGEKTVHLKLEAWIRRPLSQVRRVHEATALDKVSRHTVLSFVFPVHTRANCMSMPVVGTVLLAVVVYGDFGRGREHLHVGYVPTPASQATTLAWTPAVRELSGESDSEPDHLQ